MEGCLQESSTASFVDLDDHAWLAGRVVLLIANSSWYLRNFRASLIKDLIGHGCQVIAMAPGQKYGKELEGLGCQFVDWRLSGGGYGVLNAFAAFASLLRIQRSAHPDLIHTFTIKPALLASIGTVLTGDFPPIISITGLGHGFLGGCLRRWFAKMLYRICLRKRGTVIFQNKDDRQLFNDMDIVPYAQGRLIRGSGVDVHRFAPRETIQTNRPPRALYVGRMLREKGVVELMQAAELLNRRGVEVEILLAGGTQLGNPSSISGDELLGPGFRWLGEVVPIDDLLASADMLVLPSWREGLPRTAIEAMAMGKAVIATDVPGCREVVRNNISGLLIPKGDVDALADAISRLTSDEGQRRRFGEAGRRLVLDKFRDEITVGQTLSMYQRILLK